MKFRLTYDGPVKSSGNKSRPANKHRLRMEFHKQLKTLWTINPYLSKLSQRECDSLEQAVTGGLMHGSVGKTSPKPSFSERLMDQYNKHDVKWHPLVTKETKSACEVNILMLRPNDTKSILQGGDIDGRLKTIFDALAIPRSDKALDKCLEKPPIFYTLLSDDSLISKVTVDTDELLNRQESNDQNYAHLIIEVNTKRHLAQI